MTHEQQASIEAAYGLLWHAASDRDTPLGFLVTEARRALLALLDRDGQYRGIEGAAAIIQEQKAIRSRPRR